MLKFLSKLTAIISIALFVSASAVMASGKMEVNIGQKIDMTAESKLLAPQFKWVVSKGKDVISTQTGANFSTQFDTQGEYIINLTVISGNAIENTNISVLVGDKYPKPAGLTTGEGGTEIEPGTKPLILNFQTLPAMDSDNTVTILGDSGKVQFFMSESAGDILEYRIDKNIYQDSDGNGIANDDIDNSGDNSYLTGSPWITDYKQNESAKTVAEITLVDKNGKKVKKQVEIVFSPQNTTGDLKAVLDISPDTDTKDNMVHLYNDPHKVAFYARPSIGKILEYRIDKNIFEDSDGNGDPKDDIDNINDISFKTGDVFQTEYKKTDGQIIAQLIVVGEGGKGSRVQKGLVFGDKPLITAPSEGGETGVRLTTDKDSVIKGDPITFTVEGLQLPLDNYKFEWDFNGDGTVDQETDGINSVQYIYDIPGVLDVKVTITDKQGNSLEKTLEIVSKDTVITKSDFSFDVQGNTVKFTDLSTAAYNLTDKQLFYNWTFGDTDTAGYEKQKDQAVLQNPSYTYNKAGKYLVTLTITDADQVTDSKSAEVEIATSLPGAETPVTGETTTQATSGGSLIFSIIKILLYLILIVVVLIVLIVGGFLIFLKVQHPELTFEELIDEFKVKILTMIGAHEEMIHPSEVPPSGPSSATPSKRQEEVVSHEEPAHEEVSTSEEESAPHHPVVEPLEPEVGPMPDWLKGTDVIEGQVEEPNSNDPIPNSQSPMTDVQSSETPITEQPQEPTEESAGQETVDEEIGTELPSEEEKVITEEPSSNDQSPMTNDQSLEDETEEETIPEESTEETEEVPVPKEEVVPQVPIAQASAVPAQKSSAPVKQASVPTVVPPKLGPDGQPLRKKRRRRHKKNRPPLAPGQIQPNAGGNKPQTPPPSSPSEYKDVPMA